MMRSFTIEGIRHYVRGETESDCAVKIALKKKELEAGSTTIRQNTTVKAWSQEWLKTYKNTSIALSTYKGYESRLDLHILPQIGAMRLKDVRPIYCQRVVNDLAGNGKTFIGKVENTMIQMFAKAVSNKLILVNPALDLELPKATDGSRRALTDNERLIMLKVCETHRSNIFIKLMLYCGLRPEETSMIYGRHILKDKKLHIPGTKSKAADRVVPVPDEFYEELIRLKIGPFEPVVKNLNGGKISAENRQRMWMNLKREINMAMGCKVVNQQVIPPLGFATDIVPYCLRHTYCTNLQAAGVPINLAKEFMGHEDIRTTSKIYTHKSEKSFNDAAELINKFHSGERVKVVKKVKRIRSV